MSDGFQQARQFLATVLPRPGCTSTGSCRAHSRRQRALKDKYGARYKTAILGSGTHKTPTQHLLEIDLNLCPNLDFLQ
jgi:hypothetical protein